MHQQHFHLIPFSQQHSPDAQLPEIDGIITRSNSTLLIEYLITDPVNSIIWPVTKPDTLATRRDELWQHTCFEVFVRPRSRPDTQQQQNYWEFNFSPTADWNSYRFAAYRSQMEIEEGIQTISSSLTRPDQQRTRLSIEVPLTDALQSTDWSVGICAVIEDKSHALHYYALTHCAKQPDFHSSDSYILTLNRNS